MENFKCVVGGELHPLNVFDNRYGFYLDGFPSASLAGRIQPADNGIVVVTPTGAVFVNFDSCWFKYRSPVEPTVESVNAALASMTSDPEAYLDDPRAEAVVMGDDEDGDEDWVDAEHERIMNSFGWDATDPE
jgi:hypothetical protein